MSLPETKNTPEERINAALKILENCQDGDENCPYTDDGVCYSDSCIIAEARAVLKGEATP